MALASSVGAPVFAEVNLDGPGGPRILYSRSLMGEGGHAWDDQMIDLGDLRGTGYFLHSWPKPCRLEPRSRIGWNGAHWTSFRQPRRLWRFRLQFCPVNLRVSESIHRG